MFQHKARSGALEFHIMIRSVIFDLICGQLYDGPPPHTAGSCLASIECLSSRVQLCCRATELGATTGSLPLI